MSGHDVAHRYMTRGRSRSHTLTSSIAKNEPEAEHAVNPELHHVQEDMVSEKVRHFIAFRKGHCERTAKRPGGLVQAGAASSIRRHSVRRVVSRKRSPIAATGGAKASHSRFAGRKASPPSPSGSSDLSSPPASPKSPPYAEFRPTHQRQPSTPSKVFLPSAPVSPSQDTPDSDPLSSPPPAPTRDKSQAVNVSQASKDSALLTPHARQLVDEAVPAIRIDTPKPLFGPSNLAKPSTRQLQELAVELIARPQSPAQRKTAESVSLSKQTSEACPQQVVRREKAPPKKKVRFSLPPLPSSPIPRPQSPKVHHPFLQQPVAQPLLPRRVIELNPQARKRTIHLSSPSKPPSILIPSPPAVKVTPPVSSTFSTLEIDAVDQLVRWLHIKEWQQKALVPHVCENSGEARMSIKASAQCHPAEGEVERCGRCLGVSAEAVSRHSVSGNEAGIFGA